MNRIIIPLIIVMTFVFFDCSSNGIKDPKDPKDYKRYYNKKNEFSISYPRKWLVSKGYKKPQIVTFIRPSESSTDRGGDNVIVAVERSSLFLSLKQLQNNIIQQQKMLLKFTIHDKGDISMVNAKALWHIYSYKFSGHVIKGIQYVVMKNKKLYSLTCTSSKERFSKYKPTFDSMARSFKIGKIKTGKSPSVKKKKSKISFKRFFYRKHDFSIKLPKSWSVQKGFLPQIAFIAQSPLKDSSDKFAENLNVATKNLSIVLDIDRHYDSLITAIVFSIKKQFPNVEILKHRKTTLNNKSAIRIDYSVPFGTFKLRIYQIVTIHKTKAYYLTFGATSITFSKYRKIFKKIQKSFKFLS